MFLSGNAIAVVLISTTGTLAHGIVTGIVADGVYYDGYQPKFQFMETQPVVVGWSTPKDLNTGYVAPDAYASPDIICHVGATNAQTFATVKAGGTVEMQWTAWPESHHGPVLDYLANCNGDCATVSKTTLEFFKIDGIGLLSDDTLPGTWASDTLIAKNNSWSVTIPSDIAPGNYVLRHEIIALHSAQGLDGAQNYPQCFNLQVTGSGTEHPEGILGGNLYQETEPGIVVNIYTSLSTYIVPGPTLYSGADAQSQTIVGSVTTSATIQAPTSTTFSTIASVSGSFRGTSSLTRFLNSTSTTSSRFRPTLTKTPSIPTTNSELSVASTEPIALTASSSIPTPTVSTISEIVTIKTCSSAAPTTTKNASTNSISASVEMPAGTTLDDLLSWISTFYEKHGKEAYAENTVARRHARQVVYK